MPVATVSTVPVRKDLKSLPAVGEEEGGWVELRRMSHGEKLHRQDLAMDVSMKQETRRGRQQDAEMKLAPTQTKVTEYEFSLCVTDHNLTHANGQKMNFKNPHDVQLLDPKVGEEIAMYIDEMNTFSEEERGNSSNESGT